ncbi:MAG: alpha/beta fold hydrolase [Kiritimatiellae bacterium]|nr:alpha/beta fold hydrolase [Kiritimatiellia bacterium]
MAIHKTLGLVVAVALLTAAQPALALSIGPAPKPGPALAARIAAGDCEVYGIVHWGLNTYTDREWGYGDEDPALLNPAKFDADQIVGACKAGGLGGLVVVAKHHDGFCLWPTKTTEHNITKTPFWRSQESGVRSQGRDYVKEMERACRKAGLKFGVYVSPWDRHDADYATPKYVEKYHAQIKELLSGDYGEIFEMWFDGANGGDGWYGGAKERRRIGGGYYRFPEVYKFVRELQPKVCIFAGESDDSDFRWPGNEKGELDPNSCATICTVGGFVDGKYGNPEYKNRINRGMRRFENTVAQPMFFRVCECDFPMRPGWFYHERERGRTKSAAYLMQRYLNTIGNGGTMNIGIAPNKDGRLDEEDVKALKGFKTLKDAFFGDCRGKCNVIVAWEDVSNGEISRDWTVKYKDKVVASGTTLGIKRIRVLDEAVPNNDLEWNSGNVDGTPGEGYSAHVRFYYADPELVKIVKSATTESGETDTAKWMMAGKQGARDEGVAQRIAATKKVLRSDTWYGYSRTVFDFEGHEAWVVSPSCEPAAGLPWTWTMQWAEAYVDRTGVLDLLAKGWHHVTIDTFRHRMDEEGLRISRAFQKFLVEELGFAPKANLVGMSWGGFFSTRYAATFPECVGKIYLDAPLMNFSGFAEAGGSMTPTEAAARIGPWANMPPADGDWNVDARMPVNMADRLAKAGIPILLLYGGQDATVPPASNCELFAEKFKAAGGKIDVHPRGLYGHHPHGEDPNKTSSIVSFFESK